MESYCGNFRYAKYDETKDYYATEPKATELLLELEKFSDKIWEPACGEGHIAEVLKAHGYEVIATDLIDRGYGEGGLDFLSVVPSNDGYDCDIVTNPPYKYAREFVEKALELIQPGRKVAMFLKLQFLEGQSRRILFRDNPPMTVYVSSSRLQCGKNGVFEGSSTVAYAWYIWQKGHIGPTYIKWFN